MALVVVNIFVDPANRGAAGNALRQVPILTANQVFVIAANVEICLSIKKTGRLHPGHANVKRPFQTFALRPKTLAKGFFGDGNPFLLWMSDNLPNAGFYNVPLQFHVGINNHDVAATGLADPIIPLGTALRAFVIYLFRVGPRNLLRIVGGIVINDHQLDLGVGLLGN